MLEETEDESDEEEVAKFFLLMNKAEKKNKKRIASKQNQFGSKKSDWRNAALGDPEEEATDTDDEDDYQETRKFLSLIEKAKKKNTKVSIKWSNGQVKVEREQEKKEIELKQLALRKKQMHVPKFRTGGKRKFEDRMSLNEAKVEDFDDTKDYVNFLQNKLQGVRIKVINESQMK